MHILQKLHAFKETSIPATPGQIDRNGAQGGHSQELIAGSLWHDLVHDSLRVRADLE